jgi:hypothetical protein
METCLHGSPAARALAVDLSDHVHGTPLWSGCRVQTLYIHETTSTRAIMVLEAGYPSTTGFRKVVKATILVRKKPGMSDEAFIDHYNHVHAQMAAPVLQKHNVITYSLVCYISL